MKKTLNVSNPHSMLQNEILGRMDCEVKKTLEEFGLQSDQTLDFVKAANRRLKKSDLN